MNEYQNCKKCTPTILMFGVLSIMLSSFLSMSCEPGEEVREGIVENNNIETVGYMINDKKER